MAAQRKGMLPWKGVTVILLACSITGAVGDVPDGVVYTDLHTTVLKGNTTILKCEFFGDPIAIYWKKGDDPDQGTNLISWVEGSNPSGSCVTDNACDMGDHYSLIIRDARISDQGRYICQVSNYLGILIHNYTDVKIYAPPTKPFPVIDECVESGSSTFNSRQPCSVLSNGSIVISCTVLNYYPDLDLFFLHGSEKITDAEINKATNIDGTKNKAISIKVSPSETPYVCVASDIPGSNDQRATTISVKSVRPTESTITAPQGSPTSSITKGREMDKPNDNKAAKIAVPIVIMLLIVGIGFGVFFALRQWKRRSITAPKQDFHDQTTTSSDHSGSGDATKIGPEEEMPLLSAKANISGDISFYELWSLAYETPENDKMRIHQVLTKLGIKTGTERLTIANIYDLLCKWKEEKKTDNLAEILRKALKSADLESRWIHLCEQRKRTESKVSEETLEQIILEIKNPDKTRQFLGKLIPNRPVNIEVKGEGKDIIEEALTVTREWRKGPFEENQFASLSLALERSGCSPLDRIFFGGMVSFFELWSLTNSMKDDDVKKVYPLFEDLGIDQEDDIKGEELYEFFCSWKDSTKMICQGKTLRDALEKANFKGAWKIIQDIRSQNNTEVSVHILEHILRHVKDSKKIDQLLRRLTSGDQKARLHIAKDLNDIIQEAMEHLKMWKGQLFDENPLVLLSLALELTGCRPMDRTFFKVPPELTLAIDEFKIGLFVDNLTSRHIKKLKQCLNITKTETLMIKENKETIFDMESMIGDWIAQEECSNYEKRWKLNKAVDSIGRQDLEDFPFGETKPAMHIGVNYEEPTAHKQGQKVNFQWSDFIKDAYPWIVSYISPSQFKNLFGESDDPQNTLRSSAEHWMAKKSKQDLRKMIRQKLKSRGLEDRIPSELEQNVYLCEILDVAFRLLLDDVYPLAKDLGISDEKLVEYRVDYAPDHLKKGTTGALIKFSETNKSDRAKVCQAISDSGYVDIALLLEYGKCRASSSESPAVIERINSDIESFEQPFISTILSQDAKKLPDQRVIAQPKSTSLLDKRSTDVKKALPSDGFSESRPPDTKGESDKMGKDVGKADKTAIAHRLAQILGVKVAQQSSAQDISTRQVIETWGKKTSLGKDDRRKLSDKLLRAGFKELAFEVMTGSVPLKKNKFRLKRGKQQKVGKQDKLAESDNDAQSSDDNEEKDNQDDVEPAIKTSVDRSIEHSGAQVSREGGEPAITDNGDRIIKDKSSDSSRVDSCVQADIDSDDPEATRSDGAEIKDNGSQASTDSGDPVNKDHSGPATRNNKGSGHTDSGNKPITDSGDRAVEDNDQTTQNSNGSGLTDSGVQASTGNDESGTKGSDDTIKPSAIATYQSSKTVETQPSEATMKDTTQAAVMNPSTTKA